MHSIWQYKHLLMHRSTIYTQHPVTRLHGSSDTPCSVKASRTFSPVSSAKPLAITCMMVYRCCRPRKSLAIRGCSVCLTGTAPPRQVSVTLQQPQSRRPILHHGPGTAIHHHLPRLIRRTATLAILVILAISAIPATPEHRSKAAKCSVSTSRRAKRSNPARTSRQREHRRGSILKGSDRGLQADQRMNLTLEVPRYRDTARGTTTTEATRAISCRRHFPRRPEDGEGTRFRGSEKGRQIPLGTRSPARSRYPARWCPLPARLDRMAVR